MNKKELAMSELKQSYKFLSRECEKKSVNKILL